VRACCAAWVLLRIERFDHLEQLLPLADTFDKHAGGFDEVPLAQHPRAVSVLEIFQRDRRSGVYFFW